MSDGRIFARALMLVSIAILLTGCAESSVVNESDSNPASESTVSAQRSIDEKLALTGNTVFIYPIPEALNKVLTREHQVGIDQLLRAYLKKRGFLLSETYAKAYSTLYVSADEYRPGLQQLDPEAEKFLENSGYTFPVDGGVVTETITSKRVVDGKTIVTHTTSKGSSHRLLVQWNINQYGQRPKRLFYFTLSSEKPLDTVWHDLTKALQDNLDSLKTLVPTEPTKMAGDPGCVPRFGFDDVHVVNGSGEFFKVTKVLPHSPAQKVGLRIGDIIEAIDSIPYNGEWQSKEPTETYEKKVVVPIKFNRNGKTIRSTIQAALMCSS